MRRPLAICIAYLCSETKQLLTEGQAKSRIEANGFANVSALQKDANGVWHSELADGHDRRRLTLPGCGSPGS